MYTLPILYTICKNLALRQFSLLTDSELLVLAVLLLHNAPLNYAGLYELLRGYHKALHYEQYTNVLRSLTAREYITRNISGKHVVYSITQDGKAAVLTFGSVLDATVKPLILLHGNGL